MSDLFGGNSESATSWQPLAARMRPRTLDEFVGQEEIVGQGSILRAAIEKDDLTSMIFWGPPGCGKSTLAAVIAQRTNHAFEPFSAVTSGVPEIRKVIQRAKETAQGQRPEDDSLHRRNPSLQQGPAGRAAASCRGRHDPADRRDHGEPIFRGQLAPDLALSHIQIRGSHG